MLHRHLAFMSILSRTGIKTFEKDMTMAMSCRVYFLDILNFLGYQMLVLLDLQRKFVQEFGLSIFTA